MDSSTDEEPDKRVSLTLTGWPMHDKRDSGSTIHSRNHRSGQRLTEVQRLNIIQFERYFQPQVESIRASTSHQLDDLAEKLVSLSHHVNQQNFQADTRLQELQRRLNRADICITEQHTRLGMYMQREQDMLKRITRHESRILKMEHATQGHNDLADQHDQLAKELEYTRQTQAKLEAQVHRLDQKLLSARTEARSEIKSLKSKLQDLLQRRASKPALRQRICGSPVPSGLVKWNDEIWYAQIIFIIDGRNPNLHPPEIDRVSYLDLQRSRADQRIEVLGCDCHSFTMAVEHAFRTMLKGRTWMPLNVHCDAQTGAMSFQALTDEDRSEKQWDRNFLLKNCIVPHTIEQPQGGRNKGYIYLALRTGILTLQDIIYVRNQLQKNRPQNDQSQSQQNERQKDALPEPSSFSPSGSTLASREPSIETVWQSRMPSYPSHFSKHSSTIPSTPRKPPLASTTSSMHLTPIQSRRGSISHKRPHSPLTSANMNTTDIPSFFPKPLNRLPEKTLSPSPKSSSTKWYRAFWTERKKSSGSLPCCENGEVCCSVHRKRASRPAYAEKFGIQHMTIEKRPLWNRKHG